MNDGEVDYDSIVEFKSSMPGLYETAGTINDLLPDPQWKSARTIHDYKTT